MDTGDLPHATSLTLAQDIQRMVDAAADDADKTDAHAMIAGEVDVKKKTLIYQSSLRR